MDNNEGAAPPSSPIDGAPDAGFVPSPLQALLVPTAPVNPPTTSSMGLSNGAQVSSDGEEEMEEEEEDEEDEDEEDEEEDEGRVSGDDEDDDDMGGGGSGAGAAGAAGASISEGTGPTGGPVRGVVRQRGKHQSSLQAFLKTEESYLKGMCLINSNNMIRKACARWCLFGCCSLSRYPRLFLVSFSSLISHHFFFHLKAR